MYIHKDWCVVPGHRDCGGDSSLATDLSRRPGNNRMVLQERLKNEEYNPSPVLLRCDAEWQFGGERAGNHEWSLVAPEARKSASGKSSTLH